MKNEEEDEKNGIKGQKKRKNRPMPQRLFDINVWVLSVGVKRLLVGADKALGKVVRHYGQRASDKTHALRR